MRYHPDCDCQLDVSISSPVFCSLVMSINILQHEGGYGFAEFDDREDAKDAVRVSTEYVICQLHFHKSTKVDTSLCSGFGRFQLHGK